MRRPYKNYGLAGRTIKIRKRIRNVDEDKKSGGVVDPWAYGEQTVKVVQETPIFLSVIILPHRNPRGFGESSPYPTSIFKHDIQKGEILLKDLEGNMIV